MGMQRVVIENEYYPKRKETETPAAMGIQKTGRNRKEWKGRQTR